MLRVRLRMSTYESVSMLYIVTLYFFKTTLFSSQKSFFLLHTFTIVYFVIIHIVWQFYLYTYAYANFVRLFFTQWWLIAVVQMQVNY